LYALKVTLKGPALLSLLYFIGFTAVNIGYPLFRRAYLINNLIKINKQKWIILSIIGTITKK